MTDSAMLGTHSPILLVVVLQEPPICKYDDDDIISRFASEVPGSKFVAFFENPQGRARLQGNPEMHPTCAWKVCPTFMAITEELDIFTTTNEITAIFQRKLNIPTVWLETVQVFDVTDLDFCSNSPTQVFSGTLKPVQP